MRLLPALLIATSAFAAPDAYDTYREQLRRLGRREAELRSQVSFKDALETFEEPVVLARAQPHKYPTARWDYSTFDAHYAAFAKNAEDLARADLAYAESGDSKALPRLFKFLMLACKRASKLDAELEDGKPRWRGVIFDIAPGLERNTLDVRLRGLVVAIAKCPGAATCVWAQTQP